MIESEFYRGNYSKILAATVDSPGGVVPVDAAAFVIGALTFRGRLDEAETTYRLFRSALDEEAAFMARFFLGIGLRRHAQHARGRAYLAENLRAGARHANARIRFYAWQGAGFYRSARTSLRCASRALNAALEANFLYGKALASDLLAYSQIGPGQIQAAGESFRRALGYAELLGDGGLQQAIHVSLVVHAAAHGLDPANDVRILEETCAKLTSEDNYSKSRILLELGRQHLLRGRAAKAKSCLDEACRMVYASQNRRYGIILNMRYAYIMHLAGEHHQALNLVRNAAKALDQVIDKPVVTEVVGLELRLLEQIPCPSLDDERAHARQRLAELTRSLGRSVSQRILDRATFRGYNGAALIGDDPLGDLVDLSVSRSPGAVRRIVESGYLQLLGPRLGLAPGASGLAVDLLPGALLAYDCGEMHYVPAGVSHVIRTLLQCLARGVGSKEELIRAIWRYNYHPLKHDQLIYTAVSRLRQLLGPYAAWIEVTEAGYRLKPGINAQFLGGDAMYQFEAAGDALADEAELPAAGDAAAADQGGAATDPSLTAAAGDARTADGAGDAAVDGRAVAGQRGRAAAGGTHGDVASAMPPGLNYRQIGIVELLRREAFVDARTCGARFKVSEVSARRDLAYLTQLGMLRRHGKGRATRYSLSRAEAAQ